MTGAEKAIPEMMKVPIPTKDEVDEVLARLFFADNTAWRVMLGLRVDRDNWKRGLENIE